MGDHQDGPSQSLATSTHLRTLIQQSPGVYLTRSVADKFTGADKEPQLPFLLKVLSLDKALPLQARPEKSPAQGLQFDGGESQTKVPDVAESPRPGVAIALSPTFESFIGFRPVSEIRSFLRDVKELRDIIGQEASEIGRFDNDEMLEEHLKGIFGQIFSKDKEEVQKATKSLLKRVRYEGDKALGEVGEKERLSYMVQKLWQQYPEDPGAFAAVFFMNYLVLKRGEGVAVPTNCIYAFLEGDAIEVSLAH